MPSRRSFLGAASLFASAQEAGVFPQADAIQDLLEEVIARRKIPGLTIAIANRERVIWEKAYGFADLENELPAKVTSRFRLASLSKPITAAAVMQLVEKGKIRLEADIREYVKTFPEKKHVVRVRHLLGHLGGIRSYRGAEMKSVTHYDSVRKSLEMFENDPLLHPPGTKYLYSTYGYNLLGAAVEEAAGMPYAEYVKRAILAPAGMKLTVPDDHYALIPGRVRGYLRRDDGGVVNADFADTSNKVPGGGWLGTAPDMARFALAFRQARLTRRDTVERMLTPMKLEDGSVKSYGMGWERYQDADDGIVGHTGSQKGTNTYLAMTLAGDAAVAIMTNLEGAKPKEIGSRVFAVLRA
jgi:CubicO group peptidase (beta-lactamase class C family)